MGTKSRLRIKPPRVRGRRHAFVHRAIRRAGRTAWQLSRSHSRHQARPEVQVDVSPFRDFPLQSPRERGTWSAFGLAVAMHAALAVLLFSGLHWTGGPPAGVRVAATGGSAPPPLASPAPRLADQPAAFVTGQVTPLAAAHEHPQIAPPDSIRRVRAEAFKTKPCGPPKRSGYRDSAYFFRKIKAAYPGDP